MEGLHLLPDLIQPGDWMIKLDLKDAYLQVPIHPDHQKFLVIEWNNLFYQFRCLPFGLSTAPRVFTKLLKPVVGFLRQIGCRLIIYLDDILLLHQDREQLLNISWLVNQLFQCLGLLINEEKSLQIPCLQMEYLGFLLSSQSLLISVPAEKMRKIQQDATKILSQDQVTCSSGASQICGESSSNSSGSPLGPPTLQSLTVSNKCSPPSSISGYGITELQKVQHKGAFARGEQGKFEMVEAAGQEENDIADPPTKTFSIDRIRCINQGLGGSTELSDKNRRCLVSSGSLQPHHLLRATSSIPGSQGIWQVLDPPDSPAPDGQLYSSDVCKPKRGTCSQSLCQLAISI